MAKPAKKYSPKRRPSPRPKKIALQPIDGDVTSAFEKAIKSSPKSKRYVLRLFITGTTPRSTAAIANIRKLCEQHLHGHYDLEVIDIYQQPKLAQGEQIIAAPTLIKQLPFPLRKVVGDLSNEERVLMGLDIQPRKHH